MRVLATFPTKAAAGFALVIALVGAGAVFALRNLVATTKRESTFQRRVQEFKAVERAWFAAEQMASVGRGYLLAGSPEFRSRMVRSQQGFDRALAQLREPGPEQDQEAERLLVQVERAAREYRKIQDTFLADDTGVPSLRELGRRFERDLVPRRKALDGALDALVRHVEMALERTRHFEQEEQQRAVLLSAGTVVAGMVLSVILAWFFGRRLTEMYRREREALGRAERATAARDDLLAIVAHDLRSPLSAIALKAALAKKSARDDGTRGQAEGIENVAMRMEFLIKSLLDGASIEAQKLSLALSPCSVQRLVDGTVDMFESLAAQKSIEIELNLDRPDPVVVADPERALQVLSNLMTNAIKFTPPGGTIDIRTKREGDAVIFTVADSGPGIAPEHVPHVFDRFWKAETGGKKGAGLGLYIARGIVEAQGGRIWVEKEPQGGAAIRFTLPIARARSSTDPEEMSPPTAVLRRSREREVDGGSPHRR